MMNTKPFDILPAAPTGQEWWTDSWTGWHSRALQAEAEAAALRAELANERRRSAKLLAQLQAAAGEPG